MAVKASLRYAIGCYYENIENLHLINEKHMELGIKFAQKSHEALQTLFSIKNIKTGISKLQRSYHELLKSENHMLTSSQWSTKSGITSPNEFQNIKKKLIDQELVIEVDKSTITDEDEMVLLIVKGVVTFDSKHPHYRNSEFIDKLIKFYEDMEDYEKCQELVRLKEKSIS
jgi:hypothetical protein